MEQRYNKEHPMVSIVTPSYNQGRFIEDTILSVKNQDYPNIEHIIIDGGSTDSTLDVLKKYDGTYNVRWISEPDEGQTNALNKGFSMAQGEIIGWLNSDDIYFYTHAFRDIVAFFEVHPDIDIVYGDCLVIDAHNQVIEIRHGREFSHKLLLAISYIPQPSVFMRRTVVKDNRLNESLNFGMDYEYWLRLSNRYSFKHINHVVSGIREHSERKTIVQGVEMIREGRQIQAEYGAVFGLKHRLWGSWGRLLRKWDMFRGGLTMIRGFKGLVFPIPLKPGRPVAMLIRLFPLSLRRTFRTGAK